MEGGRRKRQCVQRCAVPQNSCCRVTCGSRSTHRRIIPIRPRHGADRLWCTCSRGHSMLPVIRRLRPPSFRSDEAHEEGRRQAALERKAAKHATRLVATYRDLPTVARPDAWLTCHLQHAAPDLIGPRRGRDSCHSLPAGGRILRKGGGRRRSCGRALVRGPAPSRGRGRCSRSRPRTRRASGPLVASVARLHRLAPFLDPAPYQAAERNAARRALATTLPLTLPARGCWRSHPCARRRARFLAPAGPLARPHRRPALAAPRGRRGRSPHAGGGRRWRRSGRAAQSSPVLAQTNCCRRSTRPATSMSGRHIVKLSAWRCWRQRPPASRW